MKFVLFAVMIGLLVSCSSRKDKSAGNESLETEPLGDSGFQFKIRVVEREADDGTKIPTTADEVDRSINVIKDRIKEMGVSAMKVSKEGDRGILLKVSDIEEKKAALIKALLEKTNLLGLHEVHPESGDLLPNGKTLAQSVLDGEEIVPGYQALIHRFQDTEGAFHENAILISRRMALSSWDISNALPSLSSPDSVDVTLSKAGEDKMIALTTNMLPSRDRIAVVIDGVVLTAPVVQQVPLGRNFVINGLDNRNEAKNLAMSLMHPLTNALVVEDMTRFSPEPKK